MYTFSSSPLENAATAIVFWDLNACRHVLPLKGCLALSPDDVDAFRLSRIPCPTVVLQTPAGTQYVLIHEGERSLQLVVSGCDIFQPMRLFADVLGTSGRLETRFRAIRCLNTLIATGQLTERYFPASPRERRLRTVLQALDGDLAGAGYRDIAVALVGRARVDADWGDPGGHLRDHVRRAVSRGRALMNRGYRQLLF